MNFIKSKCIKYYIKRLSKLSSVIIIGLLIIAVFIYIKYKPLYKVTLNGEVIGYVESKAKMQEKIAEFANNISGNVTSIIIKEMPEYELELVSGIKEADTKEQEVLAKVEENSEIKCRTYAIKVDGNIKTCVESKDEAEKLINDIKSTVTSGVTLNLEIEEQEIDKKNLEQTQTTIEVAKLSINNDVQAKVKEYEQKQEEEKRKAEIASRAAETRRQQQENEKNAVSSRGKGASVPVSNGMFMRPVIGGTITSKYGQRSSGFHTGLDIAISTGTPIYAASSGTVVFAGVRGGYGKLVIIDHGNGYQTYYAHCSSLYVSAGQSVQKGENISAVGTTGNSTGPHVHFEIRYNGSTLNPQNYI